jgi:hypothetical protein
MAQRTNNSVDFLSSGYCKTGLGVRDPDCQCRIKEPEKRVFKGFGPDIASEMLKELTPSENELSIIIPDSVNSLEKLSKYLIESGYQRNTPEYMELYSRYRVNLKSESPYL